MRAGPRTLDALWLFGLLGFVTAVSLSLWSPFVLDCDVSNLALGIERFDIHQHQPHPPGYLGYVLLLRALHWATGESPLDTARLLSRGFALSTVVLVWGAARAYAPSLPRVRLAASVLAATNPILLYYAVDGQTHSAEAAMSAGLIWALAPSLLSYRRVAVIGALLAAGGSLRPSFALLAVLPVLWALWLDVRRLLVVGVIAALGTAAWFVPTVVMSGGLHRYQETSDALIGQFIRLTSALSPEHDARALSANLRNTAFWSVLALGLAGFGWLWGRLRSDEKSRRAGIVLLTMALPAITFYVLLLCAEAGYLSGLVPPACVYVGLKLFAEPSRSGRVAVAVLISAQMALFLFLPYGLFRTFMLPSVAEVVNRETRTEIMWQRVHDGVAAGDRTLVISDWPDPTILRQFPLLDDHIEVALFYSKRIFSLNKSGSLTLAHAHGWKSAPGYAINVEGPLREVRTATAFRWVIIDPRTSDALRAELRSQLHPGCVIGDSDDAFTAYRLDARCFPSLIDFEGLALRYP